VNKPKETEEWISIWIWLMHEKQSPTFSPSRLPGSLHFFFSFGVVTGSSHGNAKVPGGGPLQLGVEKLPM